MKLQITDIERVNVTAPQVAKDKGRSVGGEAAAPSPVSKIWRQEGLDAVVGQWETIESSLTGGRAGAAVKGRVSADIIQEDHVAADVSAQQQEPCSVERPVHIEDKTGLELGDLPRLAAM